MNVERAADKPSYMDLYATQLPILGKAGQSRLHRARVHVCGCGGIGSQMVLNLAAAGVGQITFNDPQALEADNFNRFPTATFADLGMPKIEFLKRLLEGRPFLKSSGIMAGNEDPVVGPLYKAADILVCSSNTVQSRCAAAKQAIQLKKPILDVSVADGRRALAGFVKVWHPKDASWSACPACYLRPDKTSERGEGLLSSLLETVAALAAHLTIQLISNDDEQAIIRRNLFLISFRDYQLGALSVEKSTHCPACSSGHSPEASAR